ncbi:MAG: hypothetical protein IKS44_07775, partial [Bacteroidales bacterium]|nr:hypothetical protein [Bacteroidales bacterium]
VVAIYGIAWLADTYFANYMDVMQGGLKDIVQHYPWAIALAFFAVSVDQSKPFLVATAGDRQHKTVDNY